MSRSRSTWAASAQSKHFRTFAEYTPAEIDSVFAINNRFMAYLTSLMMLILSSSVGRTLIINLGSLAEEGTPCQTLYSGAKGFVSEALDWGLKAEGYEIDVVDIMPGEVRSQSYRPEFGWAISPADVFAESVLRRVGPGRGDILCRTRGIGF